MAEQQQDRLITQLCELTGLDPLVATQYLATNQWNVEAAAAEYYTSLDEGGSEGEADVDEESAGPSSGRGGRTLGGASGPQPISTTSSIPTAGGSTASGSKKKGVATLGDISSGAGGHGGHDDDDDDDDEDRKLFTGGEKSGLAVQNPGNQGEELRRKIIEKAMKSRGQQNEASKPSATHFRGAARTLGGDDEPSRVIEDPTASEPQPLEQVHRHLHFWANGFSVDEGPLYRNDDPRNAQMLNMIRQGRAPLEIMNVRHDQEVEVRVVEHDGPYVASKKAYKPFEGGGQRLGSPTPGLSFNPPAPAAPAPTAAEPEAPAAKVEVDDAQPVISLQIRLGDGSRLISRFNTSHTIGDVYSFVASASPASQSRSWVLMTTFPSKELSDKAQALGDIPEFKRGGVVIQKWT